MAEARAGERTVYFVDASHFVLASFLGWVWCFVRLHVRAASGRQRYNVLGALNAVTHELVTEINTTYINALSVCALLHKPARARVAVKIDYLGFTIEDKFVVGYGLDFAEKYRNLPYIGVVERS